MNIIKKMMVNSKRSIRLFLTGFSMGTADLIPGVSGGTIAFLSGIYEELLFAIKTVSGDFLKLFLQGKIKKAFSIVPFSFLIPLAVGLFTAVLSLAQVLTYLLHEYPIYVWSFFFGLVIASTLIVLRRVVKWDLSDRAAFIISIVITYFVVGAIPIETPNNLPFIFLSGMIAICAMILPGISGSFILLLLGKYQQILGAVTNRDVLTLGVFMMGAVIGLALFSRVLTWLFKNHHDISVAILAGIMLGSVRKLWPWKEVVEIRINSHGEVVPLVENNIFPQNFDLSVIAAILLAIGAGYFVYKLDKMQIVKEQTEDVESKEFEKEYKKSLKDQ